MPHNAFVADNLRDFADDGPIFPAAQSDDSPSPEAVNTDPPTAASAAAATEQSPASAAADGERDASDQRAQNEKLWQIIESWAGPTIVSEEMGLPWQARKFAPHRHVAERVCSGAGAGLHGRNAERVRLLRARRW